MEQRVDVAFLRPRHHAHAAIGQARDEGRILGREGLEAPPIRQLAGHGPTLDGDVADMARIHLVQEVGIGDLLCRAPRPG